MAAPLVDDSEIEAALLRLVTERGAEKTCCPSEVARALGGPHPEGWQPYMKPVRRVAVRLAKRGEVALLRHGKPIAELDGFRGIYRLKTSGGRRDET